MACPKNPHLQQITLHVYERNGGVVSAVCHGTAGIVNIKLADARHLITSKRITGYPEEHKDHAAAYFKELPLLMRKTIEARGATFLAQDRNQPYVEVDGRVVTGQKLPVRQANGPGGGGPAAPGGPGRLTGCRSAASGQFT